MAPRKPRLSRVCRKQIRNRYGPKSCRCSTIDAFNASIFPAKKCSAPSNQTTDLGRKKSRIQFAQIIRGTNAVGSALQKELRRGQR